MSPSPTSYNNFARYISIAMLFASLVSCGDRESNPPDEGPQAVDPVEDQTMFDDVVVSPTCTDVPESEDCVEPMVNALRLDAEERLGFEEVKFDRATKEIRMRLKPGASLPKKFKVGAPIYRGRPDREPFMAIVESVDQQGNDVRVKVRRAGLKEVFKRGRIRLEMPIQSDPELVVVGDEAAADEMMTRLQSLSVDLINFNCEQSILDERVSGVAMHSSGAGLPFGAQADIGLELIQCHVILTGHVNATLEWNGVTPDVFEFTVGASLDIALEALAELSNIDTPEDFDVIDTIGHGKRIAKFPSFSSNVGGVQVTFTPEVWAGARFISGGDVSASAGFEFDASAEAGFGWAAGAGFYTLFDSDRTFTRLGPTVEQTEYSYVRAYVRPQINVLIGGIVGGFAALEGYVEITSEGTGEYTSPGVFEGEVCYDMDGGIEPLLGAELEVLGATLVEETWRLNGVEVNIAEGCEANETVEPEPSCAPSDECIVDSDCLPERATSCTVYTCQSDCTCTVFERGGCCETAADCDDGEPSTLDICIARSGSCHHPPVYNYCESDDECDDSLALTEDSCVDNRCSHSEVNKREFDYVGPEPECFSHEQCDDGTPLTDDTCVSNQCRNTTSLVEVDRCQSDDECDDGVLFTIDTCESNGTCTNVFSTQRL